MVTEVTGAERVLSHPGVTDLLVGGGSRRGVARALASGSGMQPERVLREPETELT